MNLRGGLNSICGHAHVAENRYAEPQPPVSRLLLFAGLLVTTVVFSGNGSTGDQGGVASVGAAELPALEAAAATVPLSSDTAMGASQVRGIEERGAAQGVRATRKKARCIGCGVVESVHRSERPARAVGACFSTELASSLVAAVAHDDRAYNVVSTVGAIVAPVIAERPEAKPLAAVLTHQIVVRLADGSRIVFDEPTARSLRAGERILVIAGATVAAL
jgi:hypothetical protein